MLITALHHSLSQTCACPGLGQFDHGMLRSRLYTQFHFQVRALAVFDMFRNSFWSGDKILGRLAQVPDRHICITYS